MWVKICANTCLEDALKAAELGADAVGFVFAPSKRQVTAAQVKTITAELPVGVERVGVFGAGRVDDIAGAAREAGLTAVQMHGGVDLEFATELGMRLGPGIGIIETAAWSVEDNEVSRMRVLAQMAAVAGASMPYRMLIDSKVGSSAMGGTGKTFDWASARDVLASQPSLKVIVAGGLTPDNVAEAIGVLRPWGVDVASGVEIEPGRKDFAKLKCFIENARGAV